MLSSVQLSFFSVLLIGIMHGPRAFALISERANPTLRTSYRHVEPLKTDKFPKPFLETHPDIEKQLKRSVLGDRFELRSKLTNLRVVSSSRRQLTGNYESEGWESSLVEAYNTLGDTKSTVIAIGYPLYSCICGDTGSGESDCEEYAKVYPIEGNDFKVLTNRFLNASNCEGTPTEQFNVTLKQTISEIIYDCTSVRYWLNYTIYDSITPYDSFGSGMVRREYSNQAGCNANQWTSFSFQTFYNCETQIIPCSNLTMIAEASNSVKYIRYVNNQCDEIDFTEVVTNEQTCLVVTDDDDDDYVDDGPDFDNFQTITYQGYSSNDDDTISLTQSEYGGLIAAVFIALLFGIGITAVYFLHCAASKKPMAASEHPNDKI